MQQKKKNKSRRWGPSLLFYSLSPYQVWAHRITEIDQFLRKDLTLKVNLKVSPIEHSLDRWTYLNKDRSLSENESLNATLD